MHRKADVPERVMKLGFVTKGHKDVWIVGSETLSSQHRIMTSFNLSEVQQTVVSFRERHRLHRS
jgi:hypothetical protein